MATNYAVATGEYIAEWLDENDVTRTDLAIRLGLTRKHVSQLVGGKVPLSFKIAEDLELVTGVEARIWNNYESKYRADLARLQKDELLSSRFQEAQNFPLAYLRARGAISSDRNDRAGIVRELLAFFGVADLDSLMSFCVRPIAAYRQTQAYTVDDYAVAAWVQQGVNLANDLDLPRFDNGRLQSAIGNLRALTVVPDFGEQLVKICEEVGVAVVFDSGPGRTRCSGVTHWVNGTPVVQLTDRGKTNDKLWFTFFHEVGHILRHPHNEVFIEGPSGSVDRSPAEDEADDFARNALISEEQWARRPRTRSLVSISSYASSIGIHPGIVVGRMQREADDYRWGNGLKQSIEIIDDSK